jgi:hypothetical protein
MDDDVETANLSLFPLVPERTSRPGMMELTRRNSDFSKHAACTCFQTLIVVSVVSGLRRYQSLLSIPSFACTFDGGLVLAKVNKGCGKASPV